MPHSITPAAPVWVLAQRRPRTWMQSLKWLFLLAKGSREFFRERISVERSQEEILRSLKSREEKFLELVRTNVYQVEDSPYLTLFKMAGCDWSDLRAEVRQHGLDGTLSRLAREGVYLTPEEFKGKREVVRGPLSFRISPKAFRLSNSSPGFVTQSSGTSNSPARTVRSFDWLTTRAFAACLFFSAHDLFSFSHAVYDTILPGGGGINNLLMQAKFGIRTDRWFARKMPVNTRIEGLNNYLKTYTIVLLGKLLGPGFPRPEFTDIQDVHRIVHWVSMKNRQGESCCIRTVANNAVRIARVAWDMGISLAGTKFIVGGEPFTEAKRQALERVGASYTSRFSWGGGMSVGWGCADPVHTDEIHVNQHLLALVPHPKPLSDNGPTIHPLLGTTVHPSAPSLYINVENGDYGTLEERDCECELGKVGLKLHLHHIRSFEKFTIEGINYFYGDRYGDLFRFLEEAIPSEFGGSPGDYQLVEEEDINGQTRLTLLVHPEVDSLNEESLLLRLQECLGKGSANNHLNSTLLNGAGSFRIRREVPHTSPRGKILPLQRRH